MLLSLKFVGQSHSFYAVLASSQATLHGLQILETYHPFDEPNANGDFARKLAEAFKKNHSLQLVYLKLRNLQSLMMAATSHR